MDSPGAAFCSGKIAILDVKNLVRRQHARRVGNVRALRRLLSYHIDDLEDVMLGLREHMVKIASEQAPLRSSMLMWI